MVLIPGYEKQERGVFYHPNPDIQAFKRRTGNFTDYNTTTVGGDPRTYQRPGGNLPKTSKDSKDANQKESKSRGWVEQATHTFKSFNSFLEAFEAFRAAIYTPAIWQIILFLAYFFLIPFFLGSEIPVFDKKELENRKPSCGLLRSCMWANFNETHGDASMLVKKRCCSKDFWGEAQIIPCSPPTEDMIVERKLCEINYNNGVYSYDDECEWEDFYFEEKTKFIADNRLIRSGILRICFAMLLTSIFQFIQKGISLIPGMVWILGRFFGLWSFSMGFLGLKDLVRHIVRAKGYDWVFNEVEGWYSTALYYFLQEAGALVKDEARTFFALSAIFAMVMFVMQLFHSSGGGGKYIGSEGIYRASVSLAAGAVSIVYLVYCLTQFQTVANHVACERTVCVHNFTDNIGMFYNGGVSEVPMSPTRNTTDPEEFFDTENLEFKRVYSYFKHSKKFDLIMHTKGDNLIKYTDTLEGWSYNLFFLDVVLHTISSGSDIFEPFVCHILALAGWQAGEFLHAYFFGLSYMQQSIFNTALGFLNIAAVDLITWGGALMNLFFRVTEEHADYVMYRDRLVCWIKIAYAVLMIQSCKISPWFFDFSFWKVVRWIGTKISVSGTTLKAEEGDGYNLFSDGNEDKRNSRIEACLSAMKPHVKMVLKSAARDFLFYYFYVHNSDPQGLACKAMYIAVFYSHLIVEGFQPKSFVSATAGLLHVHALLAKMKQQYLFSILDVSREEMPAYLKRPGLL